MNEAVVDLNLVCKVELLLEGAAELIKNNCIATIENGIIYDLKFRAIAKINNVLDIEIGEMSNYEEAC